MTILLVAEQQITTNPSAKEIMLRLHLKAAVLHSNIGTVLYAKHQFAGAMESYRKSFQFRTKYNRLSVTPISQRTDSEDQSSADFPVKMRQYVAELENEFARRLGNGTPDEHISDAFRIYKKKNKPSHFSICFFANPIVMNAETHADDLSSSPAKLDKIGAACTLFNMALVHLKMGSNSAAIKVLQMALESISSANPEAPFKKELSCMIHTNIGHICFVGNRFTDAMDNFSRAYEACSEIAHHEEYSLEVQHCHRKNCGYVLLNMALTSTKSRRIDEAENLCEDAYDMFYQVESESGQPEEGLTSVTSLMNIVQRKETRSKPKVTPDPVATSE
uniref:MalT-like TPR region domain-containing protein n=1 Tax=Helicotheca tamesis TaxID=374047 RepID=A0A7S2HNA7_9STRA|mmetsp:Transcript_19523/g.26791  ORF Transcript_19523/g.26791 Transcript_19523/m.26791 type:complete len:333 (+) Transcript_19523:52-1050(+)|eukprot:CAMPEP_0185729690 /NCGR_PEP_ID=MMETSP1171-20130828/6979_1 /TAXON_ID=374046 /ORGANISM="Helicotheca tamensis, Strain CCMP826" /LENGTH=332 /DNA_ID=CAMNT_0028398587 /DNA_START=21 /DNA_END=1019 /DNA_ORIENTATION=-